MDTQTIVLLGTIVKFIREYPIPPEEMMDPRPRGLTVGSPTTNPTAKRLNKWSVYQDLANHIEEHMTDLWRE